MTLVLGALTAFLSGCGAGSRPSATPTVFSQPTADLTMDAVVRGIVTIGAPAGATRTPTSAALGPGAPPTLAPLPTVRPVPTLAPVATLERLATVVRPTARATPTGGAGAALAPTLAVSVA